MTPVWWRRILFSWLHLNKDFQKAPALLLRKWAGHSLKFKWNSLGSVMVFVSPPPTASTPDSVKIFEPMVWTVRGEAFGRLLVEAPETPFFSSAIWGHSKKMTAHTRCWLWWQFAHGLHSLQMVWIKKRLLFLSCWIHNFATAAWTDWNTEHNSETGMF